MQSPLFQKDQNKGKPGIPFTFKGKPSYIQYLILFLPAFLSLYLVLGLSVDVPRRDEWATPGNVFLKVIEGNLTWPDLIAQHNESRKLIFNLLSILAGLTLGWRVPIFAFLSWFCVFVIRLILLKLMNSESRPYDRVAFILDLLISGVLFLPCQWVYRNLGISLIWVLPILCLALCLWIQMKGLRYPIQILLCALLSFISTFSYASGMMCWILGCPLWMAYLRKKADLVKYRSFELFIWTGFYLFLAVMTIGFYFCDYQKPLSHPSLDAVLKNPVLGAGFFLAWLGAPYDGYFLRPYSSFLIGMIIFISMICVSIYIFGNIFKSNHIKYESRYEARPDPFGKDERPASSHPAGTADKMAKGSGLGIGAPAPESRGTHGRESVELQLFSRILPGFLIMLYGVLLGLIIMIGRAGMGFGRAFTHSYTSISIYVVIGLLGITHILHQFGSQAHAHRRRKIFCKRFLFGGLFFLIVLSWARSIFFDFPRDLYSRNQNYLTLSLISQIPNNPLLVLLNPKPDSIVQKAILFKEKGILKYKKIDIASWIYGKLATPDGIGAGTYRIERTKKGEISISGWAVIPKKSRPADFVIITRMNELGNASLYTALSVGLKRPDAVQSLQEKAVLSSGFYVSIKTEKDFEKYQYGVFAVDQRNHLLYSLHSDDS